MKQIKRFISTGWKVVKVVFSASFVSTMALSRIKKLLVVPTCVFFILFGYYASNCAIHKCFDEDSEHLLSSNTYRFDRTQNSREYWINHLARYQLFHNYLKAAIFLNLIMHFMKITLFSLMWISGMKKIKTLISRI